MATLKQLKSFWPANTIFGKNWWSPVICLILSLCRLSSQAQISLNVTDFGAKGDAAQVWVNTVSNSVVVSFSNNLSSADIGKAIELFNVGQQQIGNNSAGVWSTNYQGLVDHITNVVGNLAYLSGDIPQVTSNHVLCIYGTDNSKNFQACVDAANGTNVTINVPAGTYLLIPACQYTNFVPNPDNYTYWLGGFNINKGGLSFKGAGSGSTVLMAMGAWKRQQGNWHYSWDNPANLHYTDVCVRGQAFLVIAPVTNNYPIVFQDMAFDGGMPLAYDGNGGNMYANTRDGVGWDGTSGASYDCGSGLLPVLRTFKNCQFQHMKGEMIKGLTSDPGSAQTVISNCFFFDGNATAFNMNTAHTITGCTFSNMYQIEEFYLAHSTVYPSFFVNNFATNIFHNIISLNGGTLTNQNYTISNNLLYCQINGNILATCPAANVYIVSNTIVGDINWNSSAVVIGQAGAQPGSADACNKNIIVYGNTLVNCSQAFQLAEGTWAGDNSHADGVRIYNNKISGTRSCWFLNAGVWATNIYLYSNDLSGVVGNIGLISGGDGSTYASVSTNNAYWGTIIVNGEWGPTNVVSYKGGPRYLMTKPYVSSVPTYLVTADTAQIPAGASMIITNANNSGVSVPVYLSESMTNSVVVPFAKAMTFYWLNGAWSTNPVPGGVTNPPDPVIAVTPGSASYGTLLAGAGATNSFTVQNVGGGSLSGTASVGAPFSILSGGNYSLGPNQSQTVAVVFTPSAAGGYTQNVSFTGGGGASVTVSGAATNVPVPILQVSAGSLSYGTILSGTSMANSFTVLNAGNGLLSGTVSVGAPFSILSGGSYSLGPNQSQIVTITFSPTAAGNYSQNVTLTGGGGMSLIVSGAATNVPTPILQVSPGSLSYGTVLSGKSVTNSFTVQNVGAGILSGTASVGAPFSILYGGSYNLGSNQNQTVTVIFTPSAAGNYIQNVVFTGGSGTNFIVSGAATNSPNPIIQVMPANLSYGTTLNGMSVTNSFAVQNVGSGILNGTASVTAPFSILSGANYSLATNQSQTVVVVFSPTAASSYNQSVVLTGGGGTNVAVSGSATNAPVSNPAITVIPGSIGFGSILSGMSATNSFTVQNTGGGILDGTASVTAPFSILSGASYSLATNQSQTVVVVFSPSAAGDYNQNVILTGGNGTNITVSGSATNLPNPIIQAAPGSLAYGTILNGNSVTNSFTIQNVGTGILSGTASVGAPFSILSGASYSLATNQSQTVVVVFSPSAAGDYNQNVILTGGNGTNITVSGSATNLPNPIIQAAPGSLAYGTILNGNSVTNSFTIQNVGTGILSGTASVGAPFSILSGASYSLATNQSQTVVVVFSPTATNSYSQNVVLTGGGGTNVAVSGSATNLPVATPIIKVTPGNTSFGTLMDGKSKTNNFTVKNVGGGTLSGTVSVGAPFWILSGGSYNLATNQSQTVQVVFSPATSGTYTQIMSFAGGAGTNVNVSGKATNASGVLPTVSAITANVSNLSTNPAVLEVIPGTVVQLSASAAGNKNDPITWQWLDSVNGGTSVVYQTGSGTSPATSITNSLSASGATIIWTLIVIDTKTGLSAQSQKTMYVELVPPTGIQILSQ